MGRKFEKFSLEDTIKIVKRVIVDNQLVIGVIDNTEEREMLINIRMDYKSGTKFNDIDEDVYELYIEDDGALSDRAAIIEKIDSLLRTSSGIKRKRKSRKKRRRKGRKTKRKSRRRKSRKKGRKRKTKRRR